MAVSRIISIFHKGAHFITFLFYVSIMTCHMFLVHFSVVALQ